MPKISHLHSVIYVPYAQDRQWGLYDEYGNILPESLDLTGPEGAAKGDTSPWAGRDVLTLDDGAYLYGGVLNPHFGHFLVNTLARLWPLASDISRPPTVLFHGSHDVESWLDDGFVKEIFGALELSLSNVRILHNPTLIRDLVLPHASFQEQHFIHSAYNRLTRLIGSKILGEFTPRRNLPPVYLTKTGLSGGVGRIKNEAPLETALAAAGVEIVQPETLKLREQLEIFAERPLVIGTIGSAFHLSGFVPPQAELVMLSPISNPNSNFVMIDDANESRAHYLHFSECQVVDDANGAFLTNFLVDNPEKIAHDVITFCCKHLTLPESGFSEDIAFLVNEDGWVVCIDSQSGRMELQAPGVTTGLPLFAWRPKSQDDVILVFLGGAGQKFLTISGDDFVGEVLSYRIVRNDDDSIAVVHPSTEQNLSVVARHSDRHDLRFLPNSEGETARFFLRKATFSSHKDLGFYEELDNSPEGILSAGKIFSSVHPNTVMQAAALLRLCNAHDLRIQLKQVASKPVYQALFPYLRTHLAKQAAILWGGTTDVALDFWIKNCGYSVGEHTYGSPQIWSGLLHIDSTHLSIGKFCSIAGTIDIVMASHKTKWATTYPFVIYRDFWPGVDETYSDHVAKPVVIGNDVWVGAHACILPGTTIGDGAVIGANAVVGGTIDPYAIVSGNPGRVIGYRFGADIIRRLLDLSWWNWPDWKIDTYLPLMMSGDIERFLRVAEEDGPSTGPLN